MNITSDNVKAIGYTAVLVIGGWLAYSAYKKGTSVINEAKSAANAAVKTVTDAVDKIKGGLASGVVNGGNGKNSDAEYVMPKEYTDTKSLPFSQWSAQTIATINALNSTRGVKAGKNAGDFIGWQVMSDGTIISPDNYYAFNNAYNDTSGLVSVTAIPDSFTGKTFDQTLYQWQTAPAIATPDPYEFG